MRAKSTVAAPLAGAFVWVGALILLVPAALAQEGVLGDWRNEEGDSVIRVALAQDGTLVGVGAPGGDDPDRRDVKNPDPALRDRKLLGANILWGFRPDNDEKTKWKDGKIYDPGNGKTYSCNLELKEGELHIRGFVGIPLFGRTTVWKRPSKTSASQGGSPKTPVLR